MEPEEKSSGNVHLNDLSIEFKKRKRKKIKKERKKSRLILVMTGKL